MLTLDESVFVKYEELFNKSMVTKDNSEILEWSKQFTIDSKLQHLTL